MACIPFFTPCGFDLLEGPPGAGVDRIRGVVYWTPAAADGNTSRRFTIATARDPCGNRAVQSWTVAVAPAPVIHSFAASASNVNRGQTATLTAVFTGNAEISSIGAVTSGVPVVTPPLNASATFTLTVYNATGTTRTQSLTISVPTPPSIVSLSASPLRIPSGASATVSWTPSGDFTTARLDPLGTDVRGVRQITVTPAVTTRYSLFLADDFGATASADVQVEVVPTPEIQSFSASASLTAFGTRVRLTGEFSGTGQVLILRDDGVAVAVLADVTSGQSVDSPPILRYSGFRLTVSDVFGRQASRDAYVDLTGPGSFSTGATPLLPTRRRHSATTLADGRIFIAGGVFERSTELYDPVAGTFTAGPILIYARQLHAAVLLVDGRVLLLSGNFPAGKDEIYDPVTNQVTATPWDSVFFGTGFRLPDNRVFLGGAGSGYLFDASATVRSPSIPSGIVQAGCLDSVSQLNDGRILAVLGDRSPSALFSPSSDSYAATGSASRYRGCGFRTTTLANGLVLLSGGNVFPGVPAELYDPVTGTFADAGSQRRFAELGSATLLSSGKVLLAGGGSGAELFDSASRSFSETGGLRVARVEHSATRLDDGRVLVVGGCNALPCPIEIYTPD